jgi:Tfp pilus assembly protein PilW
MLTPSSKLRSSLSTADGISLIELIVAMTLTVVIIAALVSILSLTYHQQTRTSDYVQANQMGRSAIGPIVTELRSGCVGFGATAIQAPASTPTAPLESTDATNLWFVTSYGSASTESAILTSVTEHDVQWEKTGTTSGGEQIGTLTDYSFPSEGGTSPEWKFPTLSKANAKASLLAKNVIAPSISSAPTIFQYYKFSTTTVGQLEAIEASKASSAASKHEVAKVSIAFTQAPEDGSTSAGRTASFADSVVFRFTTASTASEATNSPCE